VFREGILGLDRKLRRKRFQRCHGGFEAHRIEAEKNWNGQALFAAPDFRE